MSFRRIGLCLFGIVAVSGPAAAGPLWFTYRVDGSTTQDTAGPLRFDAVQPGPVSLDQPPGPTVRLVTVRLGGVPPTDPSNPLGDVPDDLGRSRFALKLQITDTATNAVGVARLTGWVDAHWTRGLDDTVLWDGVTLGFDTTSQTVVIGGRTVRVYTAGGAGLTADDAVGVVSMSLNPAPEPGTLALAGIGIAGLIGAGRRRVRPSS